VSSRYLVDGSVLSWARSKLEGKIAQKREDLEYERSRGTPESLADELETLAELEQDLRAATPQPDGDAVVVDDEYTAPRAGVENAALRSLRAEQQRTIAALEAERDAAIADRNAAVAVRDAETDRLKRDMAYYERGLERLRGVVEALDCIDRDADEAGIHREVVDRWRRGGE